MAKRPFNINIGGRVQKIKTQDFLVALYEAISNSIHSVESSGRAGEIDIEILREPRQAELVGEETERQIPITGFAVTDNGVGFDEGNTVSFSEADSRFKATIGGKGVGRFTWLKFFETASIESVFADNGVHKKRSFVFTANGIDEEDLIEVTSPLYTTVRLGPLLVAHEPKTRKSLPDIAVDIVEHFIAYLVTDSLPSLKVHDGAAVIDIGEFYRRSIALGATRHQFVIKDRTFDATGIRFFLGRESHTAFLCGNKRVADRILLGRRNPFFAKRFLDESLRAYALYLFVQSEYLDEIVHDDREGFNFPEPGTLLALNPGAVTREEIAAKVFEMAHEVLSDELAQLKAQNVERVTSFVSNECPQYRLLIPRQREAVESIHETDKVKLDLALRRLQFEDQLRTREEVSALLKKAEEIGGADSEEWTQRSAKVLEKLSEESKASLAAYIVQRKSLLDVLQKRMEVDNGEYAREEAIHQLIFPMRATSDDVNYEQQNLWILDERLSYHYYLASDRPLSTAPSVDSQSRREPDIIVFNRPIALNDRPEGERLESIVIIEFKRPGESAVDGAKNPVVQILEYIELIRDGRAKNRKGRPIHAPESTYFFGYAICEVDTLLKKALKRMTMKETPDSRGMFGFFEDHRAYIEVVSYDKMLDDARKRNRILFDKLQLPTV